MGLSTGTESPRGQEGAPKRVEFSISALAVTDIAEVARRLIEPTWPGCGDVFTAEATMFLANGRGALYGARTNDGVIVGAGLVNLEQVDWGSWAITWVVADEACRGSGIGKAITEELVHHADTHRYPDTHSCAVRLSTEIPAFYEKLGFRTISRRINAQHMHLMERQLDT